jgi:hypothetical protein
MLEQEMDRRVRRHLVLASLAVATGCAAFGFALYLGSTGTAGVLPAVLATVGVTVAPMIGLWSTYRNLRCPSCNGFVVYEVSANTSLIGPRPAKCHHCKTPIFGEPTRKTRAISIAVSLALIVALFTSFCGFVVWNSG